MKLIVVSILIFPVFSEIYTILRYLVWSKSQCNLYFGVFLCIKVQNLLLTLTKEKMVEIFSLKLNLKEMWTFLLPLNILIKI